MITGSIVALVTPMTLDGELDWQALDNLVDFHLYNGTSAIVAVGTTGESATLDVQEHIAVIERVVSRVNGKIPVIAGTGANSTSEAIELTKNAKKAGADLCLSVVPYYNKPTQEGLYRHFAEIAQSCNIDQILYNVPGRTVCDMSNDTVVKLTKIPNIIGIKDATGDLERGKELIKMVPQDFAVYSGDDFTAIELILAGAQGNISVTANCAPKQMSELCRLGLNGEREAALAMQLKLMPLHQALFKESNPIPIKWALHELGLIDQGIRLPLTPLSYSLRRPLSSVLEQVGVMV